MWCRKCNLETNECICPICGAKTVEDLPVEIYWCKDCLVPIVHFSTAADKGTCPICGKKTHYLTSDLRVVFPEERLLLALLLGENPDTFMSRSVWAANSRYYVDGKSLAIPVKIFAEADADAIAKKMDASSVAVDYTFFDSNIQLFIEANQHMGFDACSQIGIRWITTKSN